MNKLAPYLWTGAFVAYFVGALAFAGYLIADLGGSALENAFQTGPEVVVMVVESR